MRKTKIVLLIISLLVLFSAGGASADPSVTLDPTYAQRLFHDSNGDKEKTRIHINLSGASDLLNFSVKVNYDPAKLNILEFHVNDDVWDFVQNGYFKDHDLFMFGASSTPVTGNVLIGWLVVEHGGGLDDTPAFTTLNIELAGETGSGFDNFVTSAFFVVDGNVDFSGAGASLCIPNHFDTDACQGDFDGDNDVDQDDHNRFYAAYGTSGSAYPDANYDPAADLDADGDVDDDDKATFDADYNRTLPCPVCGGHEIVTSHDETGGDIYPGPDTQENGHVSVADGSNYTFDILPDPNYSVLDVTENVGDEENPDLVSLLPSCTKTGADYGYTFTNVTADHDLHASFCECVGDIDGDLQIRSSDYTLFRQAYGSQEGDSNWNPRADLSGDGQVRSDDYTLFRQNYGKICPTN